MDNQKLLALFQEFLLYLREPVSFEALNDDKAVSNDPVVKKFKNVCTENTELVTKAMELIAKNIQQLDLFKSGIISKVLCECIDIKKANNFVTNFVIGMLLRNLVLVDRYISKSLNYMEDYDINLSTPVEIRAWKCLDFVVEPASIILSTNIMARKKLRENKNYFTLLSRLKCFAKPIDEIFNIYRLADEKELILIHPQKIVGFKVVLNEVQNNYHFFTLVQNELAQKVGSILGISSNPNADPIQIAKGIKKFDIDRRIPDYAMLSFYNWRAYYESEKQKTPLNPQFMLPGRMTPHGIPSIGSHKIIILGDAQKPPLHWDTSEFRPLNQYLASEVKILEILDQNVVIEILRRIQTVTLTMPTQPS